MDLNQLLYAHQVEVMKSAGPNDDPERKEHFTRVAEYAERIRQLRKTVSMADGARPPQDRDSIIYGTYAGDAPSELAAPVDSWEGEGGALVPPQIPVADGRLPEGITSTIVRRYHVGGHTYDDLDLAVAEHLRQMSH